ncbi:hypothetical protein [Maricaulis maris]|jgi:hypothetical protein|uniref:hypothetical protein n=1 Tax=Maricaulis maris TaxID=74318 RepID=UPI0029244927|nr:hypothetical protein MACH15_07650 [Maricaulis maris]
MTDTPDTYAPLDIVGIAMDCDALDALDAPLAFAVASDDPWMINAGILAIGHAARRFQSYPAALKDSLWARVHDFPQAEQLRPACLAAQEDIRHFKAKPV